MTFALLDNSGNWLIAGDGSGLVGNYNSNIVLNVLTPATGAWSMSRILVNDYSGSIYTNSGTIVDSIIDQTSYQNDFTKIRTPVLTNAGFYGRACAQCVNTDPLEFIGEGFISAIFSNFFRSNEGYIAASFIVDNAPTNTPAEDGVYNNSFIVGDQYAYSGLIAKQGEIGFAYIYDTSQHYNTFTLPFGTPVVMEWRLQDSTISGRINGGQWETASMDDPNIGYALANMIIFSEHGTSGKIFELAFWNIVPSDSDMDRLVANMMAWVGAGAAVGGGDGDYTTQDDIKRWRARLKKLEKELEGKKRLDREDADEIMALVNSAAYGVSPVPVQTIIAEVSQLLAEPPKVKQYDGQFGFGDVTIAKVMGQLREYEARMREEAMTREEVSLLDFLMMQ